MTLSLLHVWYYSVRHQQTELLQLVLILLAGLRSRAELNVVEYAAGRVWNAMAQQRVCFSSCAYFSSMKWSYFWKLSLQGPTINYSITVYATNREHSQEFARTVEDPGVHCLLSLDKTAVYNAMLIKFLLYSSVHHCSIKCRSIASGRTLFLDSLPGLCPWTPLPDDSRMNRTFFYPSDALPARYMLWLCDCLSVCPLLRHKQIHRHTDRRSAALKMVLGVLQHPGPQF